MTQPPAGPPPYGQQPPDGPQPGQVPQAGSPQPGYPPQPDHPQPGMRPQPRKRRTGLIIGAVVAVLVVAAAVAAMVVLTLQGKTPLSSDEQQIESTLREFYGTLTDDGFEAASQLACKADRDEFAAMPDADKAEAEKLAFAVDIKSVDDIVVTGDKAKAKITGTFTFAMPGDSDDESDDSSEENLVKEDGEWRVCSSAGTGT
ncbi:hypothetical protein [Nocardia sp. NPDC019395]|uniref:Rv0361 family membrane protein n=1 Tax=Nocardia sp. NPDC019395 TaxID=3154686 RepID=UPI0033DBE86D